MYEDVRVWGVRRGSLEIDLDGWVDRVLGDRMSDTLIAGIAMARRGEDRVVLALGYTREGRGVTGAFDPGTDAIVFPLPDDLRGLGRILRQRLEGLMPEVRAIRPKP